MRREPSEGGGGDGETLDLRGLRCPLPVLKAAKRLASMRPGETLEIPSDDPLAAVDLPLFCRQEGQGLLAQEAWGREGARRFVLERGTRAPALGRT